MTQYLNEPLCGEVLGGLGGDDIIAEVADDFNFELNDSCTRGIVNDEINRENFNFDGANLFFQQKLQKKTLLYSTYALNVVSY